MILVCYNLQTSAGDKAEDLLGGTKSKRDLQSLAQNLVTIRGWLLRDTIRTCKKGFVSQRKWEFHCSQWGQLLGFQAIYFMVMIMKGEDKKWSEVRMVFSPAFMYFCQVFRYIMHQTRYGNSQFFFFTANDIEMSL